MKNNFVNNHISIYQCKDNKNTTQVIKYDNEYNIIETKINPEIVKTITEHTYAIYSLHRLKDGRIASCSGDKTIRIFDPSNNYQCDKVLKRHCNLILSFCVLDDDIIVSCSWDLSIIIGDYTIQYAHSKYIVK